MSIKMNLATYPAETTPVLLAPRGSPIAKLPNELISMITQIGHSNPEFARRGDFRIRISHVCSGWRKAVLAAKLLWCDVFVSNMRSGSFNLARASTFLERSVSLPIQLTIFAAPIPQSTRSTSGAQAATSAISTFVAQHVQRIKEFHLDLTCEFQAEHVEAMIPRGLTRLNVLTIQYGSLDFDPLVIPILPPPSAGSGGFEGLPNLTRLTLSSIALLWMCAPPRNLQYLALEKIRSWAHPTWPELSNVLRASASTLTTLILDGGIPMTPPPGTSIVLPTVRTLRLGYSSPEFLETFAITVGVPSLEKLFLIDFGSPEFTIEDPLEDSALASVMERMPLHQVRNLHLAGIRRLQPNVPPTTACGPLPGEFFSSFSSLETLTLVRPDPWILSTLRRPWPRGESAPGLLRLCLRQISVNTLRNVLIALGTGKAAPVRRLKELNVFLLEDEPNEMGATCFVEDAQEIAQVAHVEVVHNKIDERDWYNDGV